jgi:predicted aldo/keto reductase-like oxidoreductase
VCRLGLATRGNTSLEPEDVLEAFRRGVRYFNWCGHPDGMSAAVRSLGPERRELVVATQLLARDARGARRELARQLEELGTDYIDVVTYYYLESAGEWETIQAAGGAAEVVEEARRRGALRAVGVTTHQRGLAARLLAAPGLELLMIRYNAAHRGAEREIFPISDARGTPVVAFTCLRWGALLRPTPDDPAGFSPPSAGDCYRFVLEHPSVSVAIAAPDGRNELEQDLALLDDWHALGETGREALRAHGDRVRRHAGRFP